MHVCSNLHAFLERMYIDMKLGFVGLGIMGRPMAKHLVQAGYDVMVTDLNQNLVDELVQMGASSGSYSEMGSQCDIVMMILTVINALFFGFMAIEMYMLCGSAIPGMIVHFLFDFETKFILMSGNDLFIAEMVRAALMALIAICFAVVLHKKALDQNKNENSTDV